MKDDAKLVASIAAKSPIAFNTAMEDVSTPGDNDDLEDSTNPWAQPGEIIEQTTEDVEPPAEPPAEPPIEAPEDPSTTREGLDDFTSAALAAKVIQEKRPDLFENIDKTMEWDQLVDQIDNYIAETLSAGKEAQLEEIGAANRYVDFLLEGGNPQVLQEALSHANITKINLDDASDEELELIIRTDLQNRNLLPEDIDTVVEQAKVQNKLREKADPSLANLKQRENYLLQQDIQRRALEKQQAEQQRAQLIQNIETELQKDSIMGYKLDNPTRERLKEMIFTPNVVVKHIGQDGQEVTQKITRFLQLKEQFDQNIEQQVAFALLLDKGFDLSSLIAEGTVQKNDSLMDELRKRGNTNSMPRVTSGNGYLSE